MKNKTAVLISFFFLLATVSFSQTAKLAGATGGDITKELLLAANKIDVDSPLKMYSFSMTYLAAGELKEFKTIGPGFTPEMLKAIKNAKTGAKLIIENIVATDDKGMIYKLPAMSFKIKS